MDEREREDEELEEKDFEDFPGTKGKAKGADFLEDDAVIDDADDLGLEDGDESLEALAEEEDEMDEFDDEESDQW